MSPGRRGGTGCGWRRLTWPPGCCGTTKAGTCCPAGGSRSPVAPGHPLRSPSPLPSARGRTCRLGSSLRAPRWGAEVEPVTEATGSSIAPTAAVALAAFTGREADAAELIEVGTKDAERRGEGRRLTFFHWATAVLCNSLGRYADALAASQQASED